MKLRAIRRTKAGKTAKGFPLKRITFAIGQERPRSRLIRLPLPYATPWGSFYHFWDDDDECIQLAIQRTRRYAQARTFTYSTPYAKDHGTGRPVVFEHEFWCTHASGLWTIGRGIQIGRTVWKTSAMGSSIGHRLPLSAMPDEVRECLLEKNRDQLGTPNDQHKGPPQAVPLDAPVRL